MNNNWGGGGEIRGDKYVKASLIRRLGEVSQMVTLNFLNEVKNPKGGDFKRERGEGSTTLRNERTEIVSNEIVRNLEPRDCHRYDLGDLSVGCVQSTLRHFLAVI